MCFHDTSIAKQLIAMTVLTTVERVGLFANGAAMGDMSTPSLRRKQRIEVVFTVRRKPFKEGIVLLSPDRK